LRKVKKKKFLLRGTTLKMLLLRGTTLKKFCGTTLKSCYNVALRKRNRAWFGTRL